MEDIKTSRQKLAEIKKDVGRFRTTLDPFIKAAEDAESTLTLLEETEKDMEVLDQENVLRHEPVVRLGSDIRQTVDNFYNLVQENKRFITLLEPLSKEVVSYAGTVTTSGATVYHQVRGAIYTARAYEPFSVPSPEPPRPQIIRLYERREQELEDLLRKVDPVLVQKKRGAWEALQSPNPDRISQAAHSMREVIRILLDILTPEEEIKNASWFRPDRTSQSGITRRHRIRYALGGPSGECSESLLKTGVTLYDQLSNEAHSGNEPGDLREKNAETFLKIAEEFLRLILINRYRPGARDLGEGKGL